MNLHNDVARQLNEGNGFDFITYGGEGEGPLSTGLWCEGYLMGVELADPPWEQEAGPEELEEMLFPFLVLSGRWEEMLEAAGEPPMDPDEKAELMAELELSLAEDVLANRLYWFESSIPETVRRTTPKVGRNEPCPCGSGKKFKHCCGRGESG